MILEMIPALNLGWLNGWLLLGLLGLYEAGTALLCILLKTIS